MCTVTIVPYENGVRVVCNRDEQRCRVAALPPRVDACGGRRAAFPVDPQGGGTWIGVNDADIVVALLNRRTATSATVRLQSSRGLVVRELLQCGSFRQAVAGVEALDPHAFEPFTVVIVHDRRVAVATSEGVRPIRLGQHTLDAPLLFTSSSLGDALAGPPRRRLFERMVIRARSGWLEGQARFHDHQWTARPEISVRMERPDALTVSRTRIDVTRDGRHLRYESPVSPALGDRVRQWCISH